MQAGWWWVSGAGAAVAVAAMLGERRRTKRRETHGVGWMPWPGITLAGAFVALVGLALAVK